MNCTNATFGGYGECKKLMEKMNGSLIQDKGITWTDASIITEATWKLAIASKTESERSVKPISINAFENTTDDIEILTTALGKKSVGGKPIPSGILFGDMSLCDYKDFHLLQGISFEHFPTFQDGSFWATRKSNGSLKGFRMHLATKAGLPPEDKSQSYPIYIFYDNYQEFENVVIVTPDFFFTDLLDYSPVAMEISEVTQLTTGGTVVMKVEARCSKLPITGLVIGDFAILESNGIPIVATAGFVEDGQGQYTMTIRADTGGTPEDLALGEYAVVQASQNDATFATFLSVGKKFTQGA